MHLSTEKPSGVTAPAEKRIISRIPHSTTKKSKRLNKDMKYALRPSAYILINISTMKSTSSTRLAMSVQKRDEKMKPATRFMFKKKKKHILTSDLVKK